MNYDTNPASANNIHINKIHLLIWKWQVTQMQGKLVSLYIQNLKVAMICLFS